MEDWNDNDKNCLIPSIYTDKKVLPSLQCNECNTKTTDFNKPSINTSGGHHHDTSVGSPEADTRQRPGGGALSV